jgi:hypothetical protein
VLIIPIGEGHQSLSQLRLRLRQLPLFEHECSHFLRHCLEPLSRRRVKAFVHLTVNGLLGGFELEGSTEKDVFVEELRGLGRG